MDEFEKRAGHDMTVMYRWFEDHGYNCDIAAARAEYQNLATFARWLNQQSL